VDDCGDQSDERPEMCGDYMRCDFERAMCQWTQDGTDSFDWVRQAGRTPSGGTGPSLDHTVGTNTGHYLFIESSNPRVRGVEWFLENTCTAYSPIYSQSSNPRVKGSRVVSGIYSVESNL
jgi:hypothetical protein